MTYQSIASAPPTDQELNALVAQARLRNQSVGVTGMLLYEDGRFLQTLEGPPAALSQVWSSIQRDERHEDIELLSEHYVEARLFSDWDLLLYRKREQAPPSLWERLRRRHPLNQYVKGVVRDAFDANEAGLGELFARLASSGWDGDELVRELIEPAARAMGDAWLADDCTEFDLTLGLGILQMAGHAVRYAEDVESLRSKTYSILLAAAPGEGHILGTSLLADQFSDAGWKVEMAFPTSDEALANQLSAQQPDAVDIGLSDAITRQGRIARLRETVKHSRLVMPDQALVVSVGGRLFAEASATAEHVGADLSRQSLAGTRLRVAELVAHAKSVKPRE
ncbi:BLUF domain-containing protein [Erythrobacter sp. SCSIO 43205]|uniref:BLUF domain-containing protein n=1 Tax=Erythrobacter sp. SCSIO 43205 TaxID=2779361 RepID=UPI001CA908ED|nr:BLUF domain-containing protein [Erythrobacter sp. SCSIO 43205]UAB78265.1 BLUF domain-containing protein [Erythrobacter sp. SCSIO 43205]